MDTLLKELIEEINFYRDKTMVFYLQERLTRDLSNYIHDLRMSRPSAKDITNFMENIIQT